MAVEIDEQQEAWDRLHQKSSASTSSGMPGPSKKHTHFKKGNKVYTKHTGHVEKGEIVGMTKKDNKTGAIVQWDAGAKETIHFKELERDEHPARAPYRQPAVPAKSSTNKTTPQSNPKGPGPMELGRTGSKGKQPVMCDNCGGHGHTSKQCPTEQKTISGHRAWIDEVDSDDDVPGDGDAQEESSKGSA